MFNSEDAKKQGILKEELKEYLYEIIWSVR